MVLFVICVLLALCVAGLYITEYLSVQLYDVIYFNKYDYNDTVVVLNKNLLYVEISRIKGEPECILLIDFLMNYKENF